MKRGFLFVASLFFSTSLGALGRTPEGALFTQHTSLSREDCQVQVIQDDPNDGTFLKCPGVGNYSLRIVNQSGRQNVLIETPNGSVIDLHFDQFVTPAFSNVGQKALWRISKGEDAQRPLAVIIPVLAREDENNPSFVTETYMAIIKIAEEEACVVNRVSKSKMTPKRRIKMADLAPSLPCSSPLKTP